MFDLKLITITSNNLTSPKNLFRSSLYYRPKYINYSINLKMWIGFYKKNWQDEGVYIDIGCGSQKMISAYLMYLFELINKSFMISTKNKN
jgi:hypothetical protein